MRITEARLKPIMSNGTQCWQAMIEARNGKQYVVAGQTVELALANLCYRLAGDVNDPA